MEFKSPYWSNKIRIELLQRWLLVHSFLYYSLDHPIIPDHMFDNNCVQLCELMKEDPAAFKKSRYYHAMKDFDGSTGFGFYEQLNKQLKYNVYNDAMMLRDKYKEV